MGLPSLLEDIIQKRIDDWLQSEVPAAQIYTRDDFKRVIAQMGLNARTLLNVSDAELMELAEAFAVDANVKDRELSTLRERNKALNRRILCLQSEVKQLRIQAEDGSKRERGLQQKLTRTVAKLKADHEMAAGRLKEELAHRSATLLTRNKEKADLERRVAQLESTVSGLRDLRKLFD